MPEHLLRPLHEKVKALGLWMLDVPQEYGGAGLDLLSRCVIQEEISRTVALPFRGNPSVSYTHLTLPTIYSV